MTLLRTWLLRGVVVLAICFAACKSNKPQPMASEGKQKQKIRRCRKESCKIRRIHEHEGALYFGKQTWFLMIPFYSFFNRDPQVGEGYRKMKRDPHQDNAPKSGKKRR
ncbi:MAG: hypothetical protein RMJ44_10400 [Cytophagales bacterium]|nr:hypothetical protein [Bernardetiaceae bacterium]MDW8211485.1 hypothetical protein [Cytophagales bacterium]